MSPFLDLSLSSANQVLRTLEANWPFLSACILIAATLKLYLTPAKLKKFLLKNRRTSVIGATLAAVSTPLCSCGTAAVVLGMVASVVPWAPIVAFMVASPLTSPAELVFSAGLFGWRFAGAFFGASIFLGLTGGLVAGIAESRGWLRNQVRFEVKLSESGESKKRKVTAGIFFKEICGTAKRLVPLFLMFAFVGYFLNGCVPSEWVAQVFGRGNIFSVPAAATLGLPFYLNTESSLPLVRSLIDAGMSPGAALAFLITGAGTSVGAITGALTIARWKIIGLIISVLWFGAAASGYLYDLLSSRL
ncbi:MAG: permease [Deltaproteobacteria bacterium]|nr:permease [Deltaproteobacteria bacterium]